MAFCRPKQCTNLFSIVNRNNHVYKQLQAANGFLGVRTLQSQAIYEQCMDGTGCKEERDGYGWIDADWVIVDGGEGCPITNCTCGFWYFLCRRLQENIWN